MPKALFIVVPCYNEELVVDEAASRLKAKLEQMINGELVSKESRVVFVDDGSKDKTWEKIGLLNKADKTFIGLKLSRNKGHQNALLSGLMYAKDRADMAISIDADLQDDIDVMDSFVENFNNGCDVVCGVRKSRKTDTFFKKNTALAFYKFMKILGVDIVYNHADYRLLSKRALESLSQYNERNLFLRGIISTMGYKTENVYYDRFERFAGESKYPLKKMLSFALNGITSFSVRPLKIITTVGIIIFIISLLSFAYPIASIFLGNTVPGWISIMLSVWTLGGIQIFCIGIIGEYLGKIYTEVKNRPHYFVDEILE